MKKIINNAISRKPNGIEQSYMDSRFATPECTMTQHPTIGLRK